MDVKLFKEPIDILDKLSENKSQMSGEQLSYLCGLIKMFAPNKIVEVGVADGGTTAVVLNCIDKLGLNSEVHSIEKEAKSWTAPSKESGYLAEESKAFLKNNIQHKLNIGVLPDYIDKIGEGIDFLILDTTHKLPGELLDFLVALPYLKDGAIVVMHDIWLNHWAPYNDMNAQATRVLLSAASGERLVSSSASSDLNIGAFIVSEDTRKYVENIFHALALSWIYIPDDNYLALCRECYARYYKEELVKLFDLAVEKNKATRSREIEKWRNVALDMADFVKQIIDIDNLYIYGAGMYGKSMRVFLDGLGKNVSGYVISDGQKKIELDLPVYYISEVDIQNGTFILAVNELLQQQILEVIQIDGMIRVKGNVLNFISVCR